MDATLRVFVSQYVGAVIATLMLVFVVAFLSMPFTLGGHPGEARPAAALAVLHLC
jgi:hypothetical protein